MGLPATGSGRRFLAASFLVAGILAVMPAPVHARTGGKTTSADEVRCLALAVYWEAKAEPAKGRLAVAHTVLNRVHSPRFPNTICGVVHQRSDDGRVCQFAWWCDGRSDTPADNAAWNRAMATARDALGGAADPSGHALYFHGVREHPSWMHSRKRVARIGNHIFYR